jgi:DNA-binding winged helix-turn-helix (wHTH) protein/tetratricopeptide (TPR) repeat protein
VEKSAARPAEIFQVGRYRVCLPTREVLCGDQPVKLPWRSFEALQILIEADGGVVEREAFFARLWPGVSVGESSLNQCLTKLRKDLGEPSEGGVIETVARRGYRLAQTPERIFEPVVSPAPAASRRGLGFVLSAIAATALIALVIVSAWQRWSRREQARSLTEQGFRYARENRGPQLAEANKFFRQALDLDPTAALAYSGLAEVIARTPDGPPEQAIWMAERAVRMDASCVECKAIAGWILLARGWRFREAGKYLEEAAAQKPRDSRIRLWHAQMLASAGRLDQALAEINLAMSLDPTASAVATMRAGILYLAGRYQESIAAAQQSLGLQPGYSSAYDWIYRSCIRLGRVEEALAAKAAMNAAFVGFSPDTRFDEERRLSRIYRSAGVPGLVNTFLSETSAKPALDQSRYERASWKMWIGDPAGAMDELEHVFDYRPFHIVYLAVDPVFAPLHREKRFQDLLSRVGIDTVLTRHAASAPVRLEGPSNSDTSVLNRSLQLIPFDAPFVHSRPFSILTLSLYLE